MATQALPQLDWSIRNRIMVPYLTLVVALVGGTGLATGHWAAARARKHSIERGRGVAETLQRSHFPLTAAILRQLKGLGDAEFALLGDDGRIQASTLGMGGEDDPAFPVAPGPDLTFQRPWSGGGVPYRIAVVDRPYDPGRLLILLPESTLRAAEREAGLAVLLFTLVGGTLAVLMASWIASTLSRPLSSILRAVRAVGRGDLRPLGLPTHRRDEIGELAEGVAQMAGWLRDWQEARVQTERLQLIRQVSAGLAHELRNPLTAARMTIQLFKERNGDRDTEPLRIALAELGRMERQVRRFLQIARPEPPRSEIAEIGPILDRCAAGLSATAEHLGIAMAVEAGASLPAVRVDAEQIGQVLSNLLINALDAAGPGGTVRILASAEPSGGLAIEVEDDGPGVSPGDEPRLFQPFFSTKPEGVGLGLSLCAALVREHGGAIGYGRAGGRTRFRVTLPGVTDRAVVVAAGHLPAVAGRGIERAR